MTTIASSHERKEIAVDSRATAGSLIASDICDKVDRIDGKVFISAGDVSDIGLLINTYPFGYEGMTKLNATALVIDEGELFECAVYEGKYHVTPIDFDIALGSGGDFALAGMDMGMTPKQAVKYAMTRDCATGGKIQVIKVK